MGCYIPRKKCISLITTIKKTTKIKTSNYENTFEKLKLNKSFAILELQKYYLSIPFQNIKINSLSNSDLHNSYLNHSNDNEKQQKKIRQSMQKLRNLSFLEVNNCKKYFIKRKKCIEYE